MCVGWDVCAGAAGLTEVRADDGAGRAFSCLALLCSHVPLGMNDGFGDQ